MHEQQKIQVIYSVPIAPPAYKGESSIYKKPNSEFKLSPEPGIETMQDILLKSSVKFANKNFLGTRNVIGQYEYRTFKQCFDSGKEVGSAILSQKMFYHSNKEFQNFDIRFVGVLSKNRYEWVELEMANYLYNFTMVPLYDTMTATQIEYVLEQTQISTLFVSDKLLERVLSVKKQANLKNVIVFDEPPCLEIIQQFATNKGLKLMTWNQLKQIGKQNIQEYVKVRPDDIFTLSYTSGTTGVGKAVMLSHKIFVASLTSLIESDISTNQDDVYISYLPLSHAYERVMCNVHLYTGCTLCFSCGDILKLKDDIADIKPTVLPTVPRILNKFYTIIKDVLSTKSTEEKAMFDQAFKAKQKDLYNPSGAIYTNPELDDKFFKFTRGLFGGRVRKIYTAAAPISPEVVEFFKIVVCCPVLEAYGQTEDIGSLFLTESKDVTSLKGTVGGPTINTEFKLLDVPDMNYFSTDKDSQGNSQPRGEICVRGCVMSAYFKDQQQTDATLDKDGFVHTGDIVQILPNGSIKIIDRRSNFFKLAQGEYIAPEKLENIYVRAPGVQEIFVYGDREKSYLVGIVVPSPEYLNKYAQANNIQGDLTQLCQYEVIKNHILDNLNKHANKEELLGFEKLKEIALEPVSFIVHGACTASFKMKRNEAKKIFAHVLSELYNEHQIYKEQKHSPSPKRKQK